MLWCRPAISVIQEVEVEDSQVQGLSELQSELQDILGNFERLYLNIRNMWAQDVAQ